MKKTNSFKAVLSLSIILMAWLLGSSTVMAQGEISAFNVSGSAYSVTSVTDYQCIGINPANLGWTRNDHSMNLGFFEFGGSMFSEPLEKKQVFQDLFTEDDIFSNTERLEATEKFTDTRLFARASFTWLGFSYQDEDFGGLAFSIRDRGLWNSVLDRDASEFVFLGYNSPYFDEYNIQGGDTLWGVSSNPQKASELYEGTDLDFIWYREFNLSYGRIILDNPDLKIYGGLGLKYLVGYAMAQYYEDGGELTATSALSPLFEVDYGEPTPSAIEGEGAKPTGKGFGIDLGATFQIKEDLKISLAVNDIGSIKWDGNVYEGNDVDVWKMETSGINNYNIFEQAQNIVADNSPDTVSQWIGLEEKKISLPTNLRFGASYRFIPELEVGLDLLMPLQKDIPGAWEGPVFGLGTRYDAAKWVQLAMGFNYGEEIRFGIPFGVTFRAVNNEKSSWELGVSVRDLISVFKQSEPHISYAFGFFRFSFGEKKQSTRYMSE